MGRARASCHSGLYLAAGASRQARSRLAPRVRLYGLRHLRDPQAAADLAQQVLLMTLERLRAGGFEVEESRELWGERRAFAIAPAGHRVELMAAPPPTA